jgi:hypothetical protein
MEDAAMKARHLVIFVVFVLGLISPAKGNKTGIVQGVVEGPGGTALATAEISLTNKAGGEPLVTQSDEEGEFIFSSVPPGEYTLQAKLPGFQDQQLSVTVGSEAVPRLRVKLKVAEVSEKVTVSASAQPVLLAEENNNAFQLSGRVLMNMPSKDGDPLAIPSLFLDNSMVGAGGAKIIVDGVEVDNADLPSSSVKDVVVNRNPFSAEFGRPGKGRLEITTKKGVRGRYRGNALVIYRSSDLYARNAFATSKPYEERKLVEGQLDGPVPFLEGKSATFFVSARYRNFDDETVVNALTTTGPLVSNLGTPVDATTLFGRFDMHINNVHKVTLFYRFKNKSQDNLLANNFDLPEHATNAFNHANEFRVLETGNLSANVLNQIRLGYKDETDTITSVSNQPSLLVLGAFSAGGAQVNQALRERMADLEDVASVSRGMHLFRFGVGVKPRFFHAVDTSNFGGTFTFSNLTDFENNTPFLFTQNTGNPATSFSWTENYTFVQDDIHLRRNFALLVGLRQEFQSSMPYSQNLCPRAAFAYSLGDGRSVIRGGIGVFYDREQYAMVEQSRLYNGSSILETVIPNPSYPNPFGPTANALGLQYSAYSNTYLPYQTVSVPQTIPSVVRIQPAIRPPYLINGSVLAERKMGRGENYLTLELATVRGVDLFRMRDINAPFPGTAVRPDPNFLRIDQFESSASSRGYSASLSYRGQWRKLQIMGKYTLARTLDSASTYTSLPANNYDANADWARADYDRRQQLNVVGVYALPKGFISSFVFNAWSGLPYNITTGRDDNGDTIANDRPAGVWRNSGRGPGYLNLDFRLSRKYRLAKRDKAPTVEWAVDAFNALNHVNYKNFIGTMTSPFFGQANAANPPRQLQVSARFSF